MKLHVKVKRISTIECTGTVAVDADSESEGEELALDLAEKEENATDQTIEWAQIECTSEYEIEDVYEVF